MSSEKGTWLTKKNKEKEEQLEANK